VLVLAIRSDPVVEQMTGHCSEDNIEVDYVELGDRFGVGVEAKYIGEVDPLGHVVILRQPWQHYHVPSDPASFLCRAELPVL